MMVTLVESFIHGSNGIRSNIQSHPSGILDAESEKDTKNTSYRSQFSMPASSSAVPASAALPAFAPPRYLHLVALNM
ncbi:hypothetical protein MTR_8g039400 [Medicago truncatula]|uniref:Uncharacterized protein n=1 Tax=Medicago truncatula TaxID=3880 RepID=G7LG40_MEDTR|nr:hypothetical protein MTR_8g039400 [Medicago truncatula]